MTARRTPRGKAVTYLYLKTDNKKFIRARAKQANLTESVFVDKIIEYFRNDKKAQVGYDCL